MEAEPIPQSGWHDHNSHRPPVNSVDMSVSDAFEVLKKAMQDDPDYAWGWHCNLAMSFLDELETCQRNDAQVMCNHAASRFMKLCFDIDTANAQNVLK